MTPRLCLGLILASISLLLAGCFLEIDREIDLAMVYPTQQRTDLVVKYRVPPPPPGKVYVLWAVNADQGRQVKVGQIPPASRVTAVKTTLDLFVTGVVISIESDLNVTQMSNTWALRAGRLDAATPQSSSPQPTSSSPSLPPGQ